MSLRPPRRRARPGSPRHPYGHRSWVARGRMLAWLPAAVGLVVVGLPAAPAPAANQVQVQAQIDQLANEIADLDEEYNAASIHLQKVQSQIKDSEGASAKAQADRAALQKVASAQAAAVYRAGAPSLVIAFLEAKDLDDFNKRMEMMAQVSDWESGIMTSLQIADERAKLATADLTREQALAKAINDSLRKHRADLESRLAGQQRLLAQLTTEARAAAARAAGARAAAVRASLAMQAGSLPSLPASGVAGGALRVAMAQIGKPYVWAGSGPATFDCSGLTMFAYRSAGVELPHSAAAQYGTFRGVGRDQLQPGDLVFFGSPIHHVGMYVGGGMMVHAPETGETVQVAPVGRGDFVGASRPGV